MYDINSLSPCNSYTIKVYHWGSYQDSSQFPKSKPISLGEADENRLLEGNWNLPNNHNGIL